ncbi:MAG TPA: asparagine synthase (glutamine-hydrolyzing) [Gemmatimonadales bacterium]|jgi:asparagine synthase (glutamine-hydrolysing)|nr:asparagine synthase (glutamine-hydrolyzing) [Gemmatimonadales bacterium]
MCGIAGFAGLTLDGAEADALLSRMCGAIRHRGPDDEGHFVAPGVGLGMRRLSIIDVAGGQQPIGNEDDSVQVVFNGEIYNHHAVRSALSAEGHHFRTHSDTETIVHGYEEWGDDVVSRLRGMFAFALWDAKRRRLLIARDRLGIKPLYYELRDGALRFCSELRSLHAGGASPVISDEAIAWYLALGYVPDPMSVYQGVCKLPPGHILSWSAEAPGAVNVSRYWSPVRPEIAVGENEAVEEIRRLLAEAVASHLESEVPLGAFLSGGLDSSTVVALMAREAAGRVKTFSIGFEEMGYNEAPHARRVAAALGTDHTELILTPAADQVIDGLVTLFDEPFADSSALPTYFVSELARRDVTVALSGDGGDELFAGYTRYADAIRRGTLPAAVRPLSALAGRMLPHGAYGRNRLLDLGRSWQGRYATTVALPVETGAGGVARQEVADQLPAFSQLLGRWFAGTEGRDRVTAMTMVDMQTYLPGDILTKVDRTSMAVSLEARVPLLDHPLVEFAASLPGALKLRDGTGKWIFRKAIQGLVPDVVLNKAKQGFAVPLDRWFRGELRGRIEALTTGSPALEYVDERAVARLVHEHLRGRRDHSHQLWRVLALDLWLARARSAGFAEASGKLVAAGS